MNPAQDPKVPLVFLDVDGVLNSPREYSRHSNLSREEEAALGALGREAVLFGREHVEVLNNITDEAEKRFGAPAAIVLSSSWRLHYWEKRPDFHALMALIGVKAPVVDFTPQIVLLAKAMKYLPAGTSLLRYETLDHLEGATEEPRELVGRRGHEIATWLKRAGVTDKHARRVVVLDDVDEMEAVKPWFVKTKGSKGLQPEDGARALAILENPYRELLDWEIDEYREGCAI